MRIAHPSNIVVFILIITATAILACGKGGDGGKMKNNEVQLNDTGDKVSYSIGYSMGQQIVNQFKMNNIDIDPDIFIYAVRDVLLDKMPAITEAEMQEVMEMYQAEMMAYREEELQKQLAAASAFLAENAQKPGITTLPDSLQYEVIKDGTGQRPKSTDTVRVHYRGTLLDGSEFDSSYERGEPNEFNLDGGMIEGWIEVVLLMKVGAHWKVYIPPQLAYGDQGRQGIPPNSLLIFEIELLEIVE
ncbi:FKBP-type peptidyl-prolyl cis-trans isomerase [Candidatus Latescibacterota bacterium]